MINWYKNWKLKKRLLTANKYPGFNAIYTNERLKAFMRMLRLNYTTNAPEFIVISLPKWINKNNRQNLERRFVMGIWLQFELDK